MKSNDNTFEGFSTKSMRIPRSMSGRAKVYPFEENLAESKFDYTIALKKIIMRIGQNFAESWGKF